MRNKIAQITLFIILGLILLFIIGIGFLFVSNISKEKSKAVPEKVPQVTQEVLRVKAFTKACLIRVLDNGVDLVSKQGGYYKLPLLDTNYLDSNVAYFYYLGQNLVPSVEKIGSEISLYIHENLNSCLNNFKTFKQQGYEIKWETKNISIEIIKNRVVLKADLPIKIKIKDTETYIYEFLVISNKKLEKFYNIANELVLSQEQEPNSVLIGKLTDLVLINNLTYDIITQDKDVIYILIDEEPFIDDGFGFESNKEPYYFVFAARYNWSFFNKKGLSLYDIPNLTASVDYLFNYRIRTNEDEVTFFDSTDLFDIDSKIGTISFTPENHHAGQHLVLVGAKDTEGNIDTKTFMLNIVEGNKKPFIQPINDLTAYVNRTFFYDINASDPENNTIFYIDNTDLFEINPINGVMNFILQKVGIFQITITATDINGASDKETFYLNVKNE